MHTPGPWKIEGHEIHAGDGCEFIAVFDPKTEIGRSNARLIAEAPNLLEALKDFILDHDNGLGPSVDRLRAAIAKADGK